MTDPTGLEAPREDERPAVDNSTTGHSVSVPLDELRLNVRRLERATEAGDGQHVGVVVALRSLRKMVEEVTDAC